MCKYVIQMIAWIVLRAFFCSASQTVGSFFIAPLKYYIILGISGVSVSPTKFTNIHSYMHTNIHVKRYKIALDTLLKNIIEFCQKVCLSLKQYACLVIDQMKWSEIFSKPSPKICLKWVPHERNITFIYYIIQKHTVQ